MKTLTHLSVTVLLVAIVSLFLGTMAEAQLPKHGTYSAHNGWSYSGKIEELGKDHIFFVGEYSGTVYNDAGQGFLHLTSLVCHGANDIINGVNDAHGYCTMQDQDGDKAFMAWKCRGAPKCEGDFQWRSGTGKYTGLKGNNTFYGVTLLPASGYAIWKGEWELPE